MGPRSVTSLTCGVDANHNVQRSAQTIGWNRLFQMRLVVFSFNIKREKKTLEKLAGQVHPHNQSRLLPDTWGSRGLCGPVRPMNYETNKSVAGGPRKSRPHIRKWEGRIFRMDKLVISSGSSSASPPALPSRRYGNYHRAAAELFSPLNFPVLNKCEATRTSQSLLL